MKLKPIQKRVDYLSFLILLAGILFICGCAQKPVSSSEKVILLNDEGWALLNSGRYEEAIPYFDKALEIEPNNTEALADKGRALIFLDRYEEAIPYLDKALEIDADDVLALKLKGMALFFLRGYEKSIPYFDRVLEIEPSDVVALDFKGVALINLGKYEEAIPYFDKALEIDADDVYALNSKGKALINLGKYEEAIPFFDKALAIEPNNINALDNKGVALDKLGKSDRVLELEAIDIPVGKPYRHDFFNELVILLGSESKTAPAIYSFYLGSGVGFYPMGLSLDTDTGVLSGTPTGKGTSKFEVCVKDVGGRSACRTYSLTVASEATPEPAQAEEGCEVDSSSCGTGGGIGYPPSPTVSVLTLNYALCKTCPPGTTYDSALGVRPFRREDGTIMQIIYCNCDNMR